MIDVVSKFCEAGELLLNICAGTLATSKAFLQWPQYRRFVGCEKDSMCFVESLPSFVKVFAWQVLNP